MAQNPENLTAATQRELQLKKGWSEPWPSVVERAHEFEQWLKQRPEKNICTSLGVIYFLNSVLLTRLIGVVSHGGFIEALVGPRMDNAQQCVLQL